MKGNFAGKLHPDEIAKEPGRRPGTLVQASKLGVSLLTAAKASPLVPEGHAHGFKVVSSSSESTPKFAAASNAVSIVINLDAFWNDAGVGPLH